MRREGRAKPLEAASNPGGAAVGGSSSWPRCAAAVQAVMVPAGPISQLCSTASLSTQGNSYLRSHLSLPPPGEKMLQTIRVLFAYCNLDRFGAAERSSLPALLPAGAGLVGREGMVSRRGEEQALQAAFSALDGSPEIPGCVSPSYAMARAAVAISSFVYPGQAEISPSSRAVP